MRVGHRTTSPTIVDHWTFYDGQMPMEDREYDYGTPTVTKTRHGLGARGVDMMERTSGSAVTTGFPIYDAHGNNVATLVGATTPGAW